MTKISKLLILGTLLLLSGAKLCFGQSSSAGLAIFKLQDMSIDSYDLGDNILYSIRQHLEQDESIELMPRRKMEDKIREMRGVQDISLKNVLNVGTRLGVKYVLVGTIEKKSVRINVDFTLVNIGRKTKVYSWQESFLGQADYLQKAPDIALKIKEFVDADAPIFVPAAAPKTKPLVPRVDMQSVAQNGGTVRLKWHSNVEQRIVLYNLYRKLQQESDFSFLGSTESQDYEDIKLNGNGLYSYKIQAVMQNNDKVWSQPANTQVSNLTVKVDNQVTAPTVSKVEPLIAGFTVSFIRPIGGGKKQPENFIIKVREDNQGWRDVKRVKVDKALRAQQRVTGIQGDGNAIDVAVVSLLNGDESALSNSKSVVIPAPPELSAASQNLLRRAELKWRFDSGNMAQGYKLYRKTAQNSEWQLNGDFKTLQAQDSQALEDGRNYAYAVSAYDQYGETALSNVVTVSTKERFAPPADIQASGMARGARVQFSGIDDPDLSYYEIHRSMTESDGYSKIARLPVNSHFYLDGNEAPLEDDTQYFYKVNAVNKAGGIGPLSGAVMARTKKLPSPPSSLTASKSETSILLSWQAPPQTDIKQVRLFRKWQDRDWQHIQTFSGNETVNFEDQQLKPGISAQYRLQSVDVDNLESPLSQTVEMHSPEQLQLILSGDNMLRRINMSWSEHSNIDQFRLYRSTDKADWRQVKLFKNKNTNSYSDNDTKALREGTEYFYKLIVADEAGDLMTSNIISGTTKAKPAMVEGFSAQSGMVKSVPLRWEVNDDADVKGYVIYRLEENGVLDELERISKKATDNYLDDGSFFTSLNDGFQYQYRITAFNRFGVEGDMTPVISAQTKPIPRTVTDINAEFAENEVVISWTPGPEKDIASYKVYRGSSCTRLREHVVVNEASSKFRDADIQSEKSYCYAVTAIDDDKLESPRTNTAEVTVGLLPEKV